MTNINKRKINELLEKHPEVKTVEFDERRNDLTIYYNGEHLHYEVICKLFELSGAVTMALFKTKEKEGRGLNII